MLAAVMLICTAPVYTALSSEVQLQHTLAAQSSLDINTEALVTSFTVSKDNASACLMPGASDAGQVTAPVRASSATAASASVRRG
jgi:hypothetical protein